MCVRLQRPEEGTSSPGGRVTGGCELPSEWVLETEPESSEEAVTMLNNWVISPASGVIFK